MTVNVNYPLPTIHLNGTPRDRLLEGEMKVYDALNKVSEALEQCEFHSRDYYVQDIDDTVIGGAYGLAVEERQKHLQALADMERYFMNHVEHLIEQ